MWWILGILYNENCFDQYYVEGKLPMKQPNCEWKQLNYHWKGLNQHEKRFEIARRETMPIYVI